MDAAARLLRSGPKTAEQLMSALKISQPTLSRTIQADPQRFLQFRVSGQRTPMYACERPLPGGVSPSQRIYKVDAQGAVEEHGVAHLLAGGQTLQVTDAGSKLFEGLPPAMAFAAPSGFLGRQAARDAVKSLPTPESLRDWSDDHRAAYLFTMGMNLPGNLVFGDAALALDMRFRSAEPITRGEKIRAYVEFADRLKDSGSGSSAGGEQPKFLCLTEDHGHLIVKFARVGTRMAELLPLEHLALQSLDEAGVRAARTHLELAGDYVFLEVERFDRVGRHGRVGVLTAGAIDDEEFGHRDSWSEFADRCERARMLSAPQAMAIHIMAAFSELIGNGDRHFENISLLVDDQGQPVDVAPAYDILPMRYAPIGGGVDPDLRPIEPSFGAIGGREAVWRVAHAAAARFWDRVQHDSDLPLVSAAMRELASENLRVASAFAAPFLGADQVMDQPASERPAGA